jgi:hypothetical protein
MSPVRYELGFYIPEYGSLLLHSFVRGMNAVWRGRGDVSTHSQSRGTPWVLSPLSQTRCMEWNLILVTTVQMAVLRT